MRPEKQQAGGVLAECEHDSSLAASEAKNSRRGFLGDLCRLAPENAAQVAETAPGCEVRTYEIVSGRRYWKVYGPDLNERFGGMQGTGGLEAVVMDAGGAATGVLNDYFGNGLATVTGTGSSATVSWNATHVGAYGPLPGFMASPLTSVTQLASAVAWRGHAVDPTGLYWLGARYYDPINGRFLSADPLGQAASLSLYDFCGGDPLNNVDPDGRCSLDYTSSPDNTFDPWQNYINTGSLNYHGWNLVDPNYSVIDFPVSTSYYMMNPLAQNNIGLGQTALNAAGDISGWNYLNYAKQDFDNGYYVAGTANFTIGTINEGLFVSGVGQVVSRTATMAGSALDSLVSEFTNTTVNAGTADASLVQGQLKASALLNGDLSTPIYRLAGGDAPVMGQSWTTVDPRTFDSIADFKAAAGIGTWNSGNTLATGTLRSFDNAIGRTALPAEGISNPWVPEIRLTVPASQAVNVSNITFF